MQKDHAESYGFASMVSIPVCHAMAYDLRNEHPKGIGIRLAPNPNDMVSAMLGCPFSCTQACVKYKSSGRTSHCQNQSAVSGS